MSLSMSTALIVGRLIFLVLRTLKIGGGSAAPGYYALKVCPNLIEELSLMVPNSIVITGTNGKTTTARMLAHLVKAAGQRVLRNATGSNLERGIASALISESDVFKRKIENIDLAIWELDEAAFNTVVPKIKPNIMVFLNAFRDQLDRYGEVDTVVREWHKTLSEADKNTTVLLNGNDDNALMLTSVKGLKTQIFKVEDHIIWKEKTFIASEHDKPIFKAKIIQNKGVNGFEVEIRHPKGISKINLKIPGVYHVYDFLAAFSAYFQLNLPLDQINQAVATFTPAFGRVEQFTYRGKEGYIFLIKNPMGATLVFETISDLMNNKDTLIVALNDNFADGTDVSWIWDANFEQFKIQNSKFKIFVSGIRAYDLALRLKYAGFDESDLIIEKDLEAAFGKASQNLTGRLFILPTYTALLEIQKIMTQKGIKKHYWKEASI